ncbi:hypothetical protein RF11_10060 [Thelohanellus kitauei]|uniref:Uncharacterized protein n=1 Tax=Thelohanellus kitauei TaxID=669202 RepID=A0A0C2MVI2_THEKT|nr:hypothetical protein RF11_10060 [Thelohanellus kitauei]
MEPNPIIDEFALNVKRVTGAEEDEQRIGIKWMQQFQKSEEAFSTCNEILNGPLNDKVKLHSVKVIHNMKMYRFFIDFLTKSPNQEMIQKVFTDLLSIQVRQPTTHVSQSLDLFPKKTAIIFMRELFMEYVKSGDSNVDATKSKMIPGIRIVCDLYLGNCVANFCLIS